MRPAAFALLATLAFACQGCPRPLPQPQQVGADAGPYVPPDGPATCLDVCRNGQRLGCAWAYDTDMGASCVTVCSNNQAADIAAWDLDCRARQSTCAAVDRCR